MQTTPRGALGSRGLRPALPPLCCGRRQHASRRPCCVTALPGRAIEEAATTVGAGGAAPGTLEAPLLSASDSTSTSASTGTAAAAAAEERASPRAAVARGQRFQQRLVQQQQQRHQEQQQKQQQGASSSGRERWSLASAASGAGMVPSFGAATALMSTTALLGTGLLGGAGLDGPLSSVSALAILAIIVTVHELGHFTAARSQGIHVTKFAIGFGPPLVSFERDDIEYSLRLIPLGGFVAFPEDDPTKLDENGKPVELLYPPDDPDLLNNRSIPERALVISAGVIANVVFAYAVLLLQVGTVGKAVTEFYPGVRMPVVAEDTAAARSGLRSGDLVLTVDGWQVPSDGSAVPEVVRRIRASEGSKMDFTVKRGDEVVRVPVAPDITIEGAGRIGVQIFSNAQIDHIKAKSIPEAFVIATAEFNRLAGVVTGGLAKIVTNFSSVAGQLSGPVAIVAAGSDIARTDSAGLFQYCAIININLAVVNVLPLPALDGGYLVLLLVEALRGGKRLPSTVEQTVVASGFLLLTALGVGLIVRDTINLLPQ